MSPRAIILLLLAVLAVAVGCRDLVEPGAVLELGPTRTVQGRLTGLDAVSFDEAIVNVYPDSEEESFETVSVVADSDGRFELEVPRGSRPRVRCEVLWDPAARIPSWYFEPVELGAQLILHHPVRRLAGRVTAPDGLAPDGFAGLELRLAEVGFVDGEFAGFYRLRDAVPLDAEGRFEAWVPDALWRLSVDFDDLPGVGRGEVEWEFVPTTPGVELEIPLVEGRAALVRPSTTGLDVEVGLELRAFRQDLAPWRVNATLLVPFAADGSEAPLWVLDDALEVDTRATRLDDGSYLAGFERARVTRRESAGVPLYEVDAGAHVLVVRVEENGLPVSEGERTVLADFDGTTAAWTDRSGVAMHFVEEGPKRIGLANSFGATPEWVDLRVPETLEITLEIGDANAPVTD